MIHHMSVEFLFFHMMTQDVNDVKAYSFNLMSLLNDDELSFVHSGFFPIVHVNLLFSYSSLECSL